MGNQQIFEQLRSWIGQTGRDSPERISQLPGISRSARLLPQGIWSAFVAAALALLAVMISAVPHTAGTGRAVLLILLAAPLGFAILGVRLLVRFRRKLAAFDGASIVVRPALIVAKYAGADPKGPGGLAGGRWLTVEFEDGSRECLEALSAALYRRMEIGDAGVLFSRGGVAVEFDVLQLCDVLAPGDSPGAKRMA